MRATFDGINISRRGLQAQQRSLDVVGHNIANANTPGFARQSAILTSSKPYTVPSMETSLQAGQVGTGVTVSQIVRMRDEFVETRLRQESSTLSYWEALEQGLEQVELIFNEPTDHAIQESLDMFWDSMQELSLHPENDAIRAVVVQRSENLAEVIKHTSSRLHQLRVDTNYQIGIRVDQVNRMAEQIAGLNRQIAKVSGTGNNPNDLMDKRDVLLEELAQMVNIEIYQDSHNSVLVSIGGMNLVQREKSFALTTRVDPDQRDYSRLEVIWASSRSKVAINNGMLAGLVQMRDEEVPYFLDRLEHWTYDFMDSVNTQHRAGFGLDQLLGQDLHAGERNLFLAQDPAKSSWQISVNHIIVENPRLLAASSVDHADTVGNGENALRMAELRYRRAEGREATSNEAFVSIIATLGVKSQKADKMVEVEGALVSHLHDLREATSGVSLDEEMANMIRFQHAYSAAARMITTMDEALDLVINRMGTVGR